MTIHPTLYIKKLYKIYKLDLILNIYNFNGDALFKCVSKLYEEASMLLTSKINYFHVDNILEE